MTNNNSNFKFLPMSKAESIKKNWQNLDIIIITGDPYIDHHSNGAAVIGRYLEHYGYKIGIIAEPITDEDFTALGEPNLCFAISSGAVDSMLTNYTANKRVRKNTDSKKPDRALIYYTNKIKQLFKNKSVIIGGIEASCRRLAHYDYWSNKVRRSILVDSKADILVYGMGERQILEIANRLNNGENIQNIDDIRGTCVVKNNVDDFILTSGSSATKYTQLPSFEEVENNKTKFNECFKIFYENQNPIRAKILIQKHSNRFVIHNLPQLPYEPEELDKIFELPYQNIWHPKYDKTGGIKGFKDMMQFSLVASVGCPGECSFCSVSIHQGRIVQSRTPESIYLEALKLSKHPDFKGTITDIGGPTANLFLSNCKVWKQNGFCKERQCLMPQKCPNLKLSYKMLMTIYKNIQNIPKVKHVFIQSGLRYDLLVDTEDCEEFLQYICQNNISGRMKIAPEHTDDKVLKLMNKPSYLVYKKFKILFRKINQTLKKQIFLVNYYITSHPGCDLEKAVNMGLHCVNKNVMPEQIQDFIPLPMTISSAMYYTKKHPFTDEKIYVPDDIEERNMQRALVQYKNKDSEKYIKKALQKIKKIYLFKKFF